MSVHVVVDGRVFDTEAADRGMGRYVLHLVELLVASQTAVTVLLPNIAVQRRWPRHARAEYVNFEDDPTAGTVTLNRALERLGATLYVDATPFLAPQRYDVYACPVLAVLYDLIPMRYPRDYFASFGPGALDPYINGLARVKKADHVIAISQHVKGLALRYLGVARDRCSVIEPSVAEAYRRYPPPERAAVAADAPMLCIQGAHRSKNFPRAIGFLERLAEAAGCAIDVVVPTLTQRRLVEEARDPGAASLRVAHSIPEERKFALQANARAIAHLSLEEGYGIPLAEALYLYRPIVCLDIAVNRELTGDPDEALAAGVLLLANPTLASDDDLRDAASFVRDGPVADFVAARRKVIERLLARHDAAGRELASAIDAAHARFAARSGHKSLAIAAPTEIGSCGVSDYCHALMRSPEPRFVLLLGAAPRAMQVLPQLRLVPIALADEVRKRSRGVLLNLAVSDSLARGFDAIAEGSTVDDVLIVHDAGSYAPGLLMQANAHGDARLLWSRYLADEAESVKALSRRWLVAPGADAHALFLELDRQYRSVWLQRFQGELVSHHSAFAAPPGSAGRDILALLSAQSEILARARYSPMPIDARATPAIGRIGSAMRWALGLDRGDLLVCCAGSVVRGKHLDAVARVVARLGAEANGGHAITLLLAGRVLEPSLHAELRAMFDGRGVGAHLVQIVEDDEVRYDALLSASDVVVAFREQRRIQMSHSYVRALALGRPIITNTGAGFDDADAAALCRDDRLEDDLARHLGTLWHRRAARIDAANASQVRYRRRHTLEAFFAHVANLHDAAVAVEAH